MPLLLTAKASPTEVVAVLVIIVILFAIFILPWVFFLLTMQRAFNNVSPEHQMNSPGMVWLCLIPLVGHIYLFIMVGNLATSLKREYEMRGWHQPNEDYGNTMGIVMASLHLANLFFLWIISALPGLVLFIIYWVRISKLSKALESDEPAPAFVNKPPV